MPGVVKGMNAENEIIKGISWTWSEAIIENRKYKNETESR